MCRLFHNWTSGSWRHSVNASCEAAWCVYSFKRRSRSPQNRSAAHTRALITHYKRCERAEFIFFFAARLAPRAAHVRRLQRDTDTPWLPCGLTALITSRVIRHFPAPNPLSPLHPFPVRRNARCRARLVVGRGLKRGTKTDYWYSEFSFAAGSLKIRRRRRSGEFSRGARGTPAIKWHVRAPPIAYDHKEN